MKPTTPERLQWFLDRIGTTIFRDGCPCDICVELNKTGIRINSEEHARNLYDFEMQSELTYFEKPKP